MTDQRPDDMRLSDIETAIYLQGLQQARRRRAAELQLEQVPDPHDGLSQEAV